jgi:Glycosyltransferase family 87
VWLFWATAAVFVALFLVQVAIPAATRPTNGFSAYYTAARLVASGQADARMYDDAWFSDATIRLGFANARDVYNINPPAALLLLPLAGLEPNDAKVVWTVLNLVILAVALVGLARLARLAASTAALGLAAVTLYQPLREEMSLGQAYVLLLALEVAFAWAVLAKRSAAAGWSLGLMLGLKTSGVALPGLLIARKRWRALIWLVLAVAAVVGLSLVWLPPSTWLAYGGLLIRPGAHPEIVLTVYQSLPGFWLHLFRADPVWNAHPLVDTPILATALIVASALALVALTLWRTRLGSTPAAFVAWATLAVVLDPGAADYHYTLLLAPLGLMLARLRDEGDDWRDWVAFATAVLLVGGPLPYKSPRLAQGLITVLAYPKLYGALVLWAMATFPPKLLSFDRAQG